MQDTSPAAVLFRKVLAVLTHCCRACSPELVCSCTFPHGGLLQQAQQLFAPAGGPPLTDISSSGAHNSGSSSHRAYTIAYSLH